MMTFIFNYFYYFCTPIFITNMKDKDKPRIPGDKKKKHGDFSKYIKKKKSTPSKSHKTAKLISRKFREEEEQPRGRRRPHADGEHQSKDPQRRRRSRKSNEYLTDGGLIRLNKYIANAGVCSRRDADKLIASGAVMVNGEVVSELGAKVSPTDKVQIGDQTLVSEPLRYVLLNKPKDYITTTDDPRERKTVMMLVEKACKERIYPVGRLDRNTTGLLLFTNDGDLAKKLTHPSHRLKKTYHVYLDQPLSKNDMQKIADGIELDDGFIQPDAVAYVGEGNDRRDVGIELHSGKNRIVRRIFEATGYKVAKLDRVFFAGLTKKDLPRGKWRHLTREEINMLKML